MLYYIDPSDPNTRYESRFFGTWNSITDIDNFLSLYNYNTNYTGLSLGNYVTINDGTYNVDWEIAGFDLEHNQTAADDTVYDNGVGILMIPRINVTTGKWASTDSNIPYNRSTIHTSTLPAVYNKLKNVLGDHLINRNVLLSNTLSTQWTPTNYTWTTSRLTLLSEEQLHDSWTNKYNIGEANYKLPLFSHEKYYAEDLAQSTIDKSYSRSVLEKSYEGKLYIIYFSKTGSTSFMTSTSTGNIRPLILIR